MSLQEYVILPFLLTSANIEWILQINMSPETNFLTLYGVTEYKFTYAFGNNDFLIINNYFKLKN